MLFIVLLPFRSSVLSLSITSLVLDPWLVIIVYHSYHFQCGTHPPYHPLESSAPSPSHQHFAGRLWQPRGRFTLRQGLGPRSQEARNMDKQRRLRCRKLAILAMWSLRPKRDETWKWRHSIQMSPFFFRFKSCSYFKQLDLIWNVKPSFFPARWFHGFVHPFLEMIHTWTKYLLDGLNIARPNKCYW